MRRASWAILLLTGCGAAVPDAATQETAAVVVGVGSAPARKAAARQVRELADRLPKPLPSAPASVAARMADALDAAVAEEKRAAAEERRKRDQDLERSLERARRSFEVLGGAGPDSSMFGPGAGGLVDLAGMGGIGAGTGAGRGKPKAGAGASRKPPPAKPPAKKK
jgi:hypothetical protein